MSKNNQVNLNVKELEGFLTHIVNNNRFLQQSGKKPVSTEIVGDSGIGKTSLALQMANSLGLNFVKLNLAQIEELGDLVGFPVRQFELCKDVTPEEIPPSGTAKPTPISSTPIKECIWVDEQAVEEYARQGYTFTGEKRMSYCPPEWIAGKKGGGLLILDDWNRADIRFIQAVMELVDRQEYISWKLPKDWHIILTANPDNGEYLVNSIDTAQRTRFVSVNLKWDVECWAEWAEKEGIDNRCINFVLLHPEIVTAKVNPRSITTFFNCISSMENFDKQLPMIQMIGEGSVGPEFSTLFTTFINNRLDKLITPKEILSHENEAYVMGELRNCIGRGDAYRADIASTLITRIINYGLVYAESNPVDKALTDRIIRLATDAETFTNDLQYVLVKKLLNGNKPKYQKILANSKVIEMSTK